MKEVVSNSGSVISDISGVVKEVGRDVTKVVASKIVDNSVSSPPKSPRSPRA